MRLAVKMLVEVDEDDVVEDPETGVVTIESTGDTFDSFEELFEHQLSQDAAWMEILPGMIVEKKGE